MKSIITIIVLIFIIGAMVLYSEHIIDTTVAEMHSYLEQCQVTFSSGELLEFWETEQKKLKKILPHEDLLDLSDAVFALSEYEKTNNREEFDYEINHIRFLLESVRKNIFVSWDNIL